ncbi:MAG: HEAT repeat domain-containing protein [Chitinispirillaceae bacterium]|nr:HEAT repeat domain-containing protein [Chitinispirillaceae bacterium]
MDKKELHVLVLGSAPPEKLMADLKGQGFAAVFAEEAKKILAHLPDLIVLSSEKSALFDEELKNILRIHPAPLIYLGTPAPHLKNEIDDYLPHPFDSEYLAFKIRALSQRIRRERDINPLTGLPGNRLINAYLTDAFFSDDRAVVYIDINDFKPYNDTYGFGRGDEVIKALGRILGEAVSRRSADSFVGHIGGDDFIVLCPDGEAENLSREVMDRFLARRNVFYSAKDLSRGLIVALDRDGRRRNIPLLSLSVVSFHVSRERFRSVGEISQRAMLLKKRLKARSGAQGTSVHLRDGDEHGIADTRRLESLAVSAALPLPLRRSLIEALGETGDHSYYPLLKALLGGSEPAMIRKSAAYALGRLKDRRAVPPLIGLLADKNPHLRTRAVEALGEIGSNEAYGPVMSLAADGSGFVRQKVMESLGKLANSDCLHLLENALNDPDAKVSEAAAQAMGELGVPAAVPLLRKYLCDAGPRSRGAAVAALGRILCPEAAQAVCESLGDADASVQWRALCRIPFFVEKGFLEDRRGFIMEKLLSFAESGNPSLKRAGIIAMGALKDRGAIPALIRALEDANDLIRWSAALSLGKLADKEPVPCLLRRLKDSDDIVRSAASWALGEIGDECAVEPLRYRSLKDTSLRVREAAASSIVRIVLKTRGTG